MTKGVDRQTNKKARGFSMPDILALPDAEAQILRFMLREAKPVSLHEVAIHLDESDGVVSTMLDYLSQLTYVEEIQVAGQSRYRVVFRESDRAIPPQLEPGNPLAIIPNPSGDHAVVAGEKFELYVTVSNKGHQSALVDVFIDESSQTLRQWCVSPYERLALDSRTSGEVVFEFEVPIQTLPGTYNYILVVDSPQHYPEDTPIRHSQRLQILPPVEVAVRVSDPTFSLDPVTSSRSPTVLQPGEVLPIMVMVHNRSDRVDRFYLTCPDLAENWFTVKYPEGLDEPGLVVATDGLDLNPGDRGEIVLLLTPPREALAGTYFPTVRLYSANQPDLVLLDVVYLQILPFYLLTVELVVLRGKVRREEGVYALKLTNTGNTVREVIIHGIRFDDAELCTYTLDSTQVRILPGTSTNVDLRVKPDKWWRRPFYGGGELINFQIELEDTQQLPLPNYLPQGTLLWEPRPWWLLFLLILAGVLTLAAIALLIWWIFFKPPNPPKILEFSSQDTFYQEANNDFIRLNWQIRHPNQIHRLTLTGQSPDGAATVQPIVYDFSRGLPTQLKEFCVWRAVLTCKNVRTEARKAGDYVFELKVFSKTHKDVAAESLKTNTLKIQPVGSPKILEFDSAQPIYEEGRTNSTLIKNTATGKTLLLKSDSILLNWKLNNPNQIQALNIIGRTQEGSVSSPLKRFDFSNGIPEQLQGYCKVEDTLTCTNVPTEVRQAGDYSFEMAVIPKQGQGEPSDAKKTNSIKIKSQPPQIVEFKLNGKEALPKYLIPINKKKTIVVLPLSWKVAGGKDLQVELRPAPGTVPPTGITYYPISQQPGSETITLQVKNAAGEQISRSVTIETFDPDLGIQPSPTPSPLATPKGQQPTTAISPRLPALVPAAPFQAPTSPVQPPPPQREIPPPASPAAGDPSVPAPGASAPAAGASPSPAASSPPSPSPGAPAPVEPGSLSPAELPPQF